MQIMRALLVPGAGYSNHPVTKMWGGHEESLLHYQEAICHEWVDVRGYQDTCLEKTYTIFETYAPMWGTNDDVPFWFGDVELHLAHQSNLVRKNRDYYKPIFPNVQEGLEYIYPVD
jgi:hypothetical protein